MKTLLKSGLALVLGMLLYSGSAQAQVQINVNTPYWGPSVGPDVQYYYIPEIDGYYDLYSGQYLFFDPVYGAWVSSPYLPRAYAAYDPRFFHPVVVQYVGRQPWGYLRDHRAYCDRWGVQPGRYYGSRWPGRGYAAYPHGYNPGYYANRPGNQAGYARDNNRDQYNSRNDNRDNRGTYGSRSDNRSSQGGYDNRGDNNRPNGRNDNRGSYERPDRSNQNGNGRSGSAMPNGQSNSGRGNYSAPGGRGSQPQQAPGNTQSGRGRSRGQ
ncbi:hypothetical protein [Hymenobacter guriensis]|uniref:DUF3300 domain-containing protein n=1 Tax=Hymenobacter guriensis TaxID=2793065 RepID=A0ABS0L2P8_9BACT|nr:hypothetical protein [Hymenobacter guriensis]MBG8554393.1 hypothetical protein [Hymenobacter guriensis]